MFFPKASVANPPGPREPMHEFVLVAVVSNHHPAILDRPPITTSEADIFYMAKPPSEAPSYDVASAVNPVRGRRLRAGYTRRWRIERGNGAL
jgi:hypothetical protein